MNEYFHYCLLESLTLVPPDKYPDLDPVYGTFVFVTREGLSKCRELQFM
jgi:hypothetical protein